MLKEPICFEVLLLENLNELKSIHPDLNTYVSTIVDLAIAHYYDHIVNEGGTQ